MTRNGLVEENLATKETRKVTNSDQELSYKQKDVEQAFITSEKKKNSHKKAEKKQFSEKVQIPFVQLSAETSGKPSTTLPST